MEFRDLFNKINEGVKEKLDPINSFKEKMHKKYGKSWALKLNPEEKKKFYNIDKLMQESLDEKLTSKQIEILVNKINKEGVNNTAVWLIDRALESIIGLSSSDLPDTVTFANGIDAVSDLLEDQSYGKAYNVAKTYAKMMIEEEGFGDLVENKEKTDIKEEVNNIIYKVILKDGNTFAITKTKDLKAGDLYVEVVRGAEKRGKTKEDIKKVEKYVNGELEESINDENIEEFKKEYKEGSKVGYYGREGTIKKYDGNNVIIYFPDIDEEEAISIDELIEQEWGITESKENEIIKKQYRELVDPKDDNKAISSEEALDFLAKSSKKSKEEIKKIVEETALLDQDYFTDEEKQELRKILVMKITNVRDEKDKKLLNKYLKLILMVGENRARELLRENINEEGPIGATTPNAPLDSNVPDEDQIDEPEEDLNQLNIPKENSEEEDVELKDEKEYLGNQGSEDYYYLVIEVNDEETGKKVFIADAEGNSKKELGEDEDIKDFIISAIEDLELSNISTDIVNKYLLPPKDEEKNEEAIPNVEESKIQKLLHKYNLLETNSKFIDNLIEKYLKEDENFQLSKPQQTFKTIVDKWIIEREEDLSKVVGQPISIKKEFPYKFYEEDVVEMGGDLYEIFKYGKTSLNFGKSSFNFGSDLYSWLETSLKNLGYRMESYGHGRYKFININNEKIIYNETQIKELINKYLKEEDEEDQNSEDDTLLGKDVTPDMLPKDKTQSIPEEPKNTNTGVDVEAIKADIETQYPEEPLRSTALAFADSLVDDPKIYDKIRDLNWPGQYTNADTFLKQAKIVGTYNNFNPNLAKEIVNKFGQSAKYKLARDGSVVVYITVRDMSKKYSIEELTGAFDATSIELTQNPGEIKIWWD